MQPAAEIYQQFLFSLKATFGRFFWKFCLDISGVCWQKICARIQRDLLLSLNTLGSILSFVILTFWELILGLGALFYKFLEWGSIRKQLRRPLNPCACFALGFWLLVNIIFVCNSMVLSFCHSVIL